MDYSQFLKEENEYLYPSDSDPEKDGPVNIPEPVWIQPNENPWRIPVLDLRPFALGMLSSSGSQDCARNAVSYGTEDGLGFVGQAPPVRRSIPSTLVYRRDRLFAEGILFNPTCMENKWALYHHGGEILVVRSWLRRLFVAARVEQGGDTIRIKSIRGTFTGAADEPPAVTERILDFLLRSHALHLVFPAPIRVAPNWSPSLVATLCFQLFGSMAPVGSVKDPPRDLPEQPLRSLSLLHLAVARDDRTEVARQLAKGIPIDLPNQEGLPPLHWALVLEKTEMLELLVSRGSGVEAPTSEGISVLMVAAEFGKPNHLRWLLAQGANPSASDNRGFTALHRAAEKGHREIVELLLAAGSDPRAGAQGHTAVSLAKNKGHAEIVRILGG